MRGIVVRTIVLIAAIAPPAFSQANNAAPRPSFEVATIKPNTPEAK
jgi:hypothetical protein